MTVMSGAAKMPPLALSMALERSFVRMAGASGAGSSAKRAMVAGSRWAPRQGQPRWGLEGSYRPQHQARPI